MRFAARSPAYLVEPWSDLTWLQRLKFIVHVSIALVVAFVVLLLPLVLSIESFVTGDIVWGATMLVMQLLLWTIISIVSRL